VNLHNSRQGCYLDELINQSKLTRSLTSTQGTRRGHNHMNDHAEKWKDSNVHEKVVT
jgi:hypothetical protein